MEFKLYQVDAFTNKLFSGNPAAVCSLDKWLDDDLLQKIAMENNLAETAFYVQQDNKFEIRWFTPSIEVDLCGHATLAAAYVLFYFEQFEGDKIHFYSPRSGVLTVSKNSDSFLSLDFPSDVFHKIEIIDQVTDCFDIAPIEGYKGKTDYMFVFESESQITNIIPNFEAISKLGGRGAIITAKGEKVDFISRFFAPQSGIIEDPVTGSAHTTLTPYWAERLKKDRLEAYQLSPRKGYLKCVLKGDRIEISGQAKLYLSGKIIIE